MASLGVIGFAYGGIIAAYPAVISKFTGYLTAHAYMDVFLQHGAVQGWLRHGLLAFYMIGEGRINLHC